jgi:methylated-DNA-[protein]-cysteine S-methyltransferase
MTRTHKLIGSPIGELTLVASDGVLDGLYMEGHTHMPDPATLGEPAAGFEEVEEQLAEIPYGQTRTYGQIADEIGDRSVIRAVGAANGRNPISIIVPCHRVVGSDGTLTGYAGGLDRKRFLLDLETPDGQRPARLF